MLIFLFSYTHTFLKSTSRPCVTPCCEANGLLDFSHSIYVLLQKPPGFCICAYITECVLICTLNGLISCCKQSIPIKGDLQHRWHQIILVFRHILSWEVLNIYSLTLFFTSISTEGSVLFWAHCSCVTNISPEFETWDQGALCVKFAYFGFLHSPQTCIWVIGKPSTLNWP